GDVSTRGPRAGNRRRPGRARRARGAEPRLRGEVRLPLCRLRQPPSPAQDRPDPPGAPGAHAGGGAPDRCRRADSDRSGPMAQHGVTQLLAFSDCWWDWGNLLFRWLHVIAAIAWIGGSFYFIALDNHLERPKDPRDAERGIGGEAWEVHGGGFYRVEKFRVAPARLPERLHWFKWEAYTTWLSGFALFIVVYYSHATSYLIDPTVRDLTAWEAITLSVVGIMLARLVYELLCRPFADD